MQATIPAEGMELRSLTRSSAIIKSLVIGDLTTEVSIQFEKTYVSVDGEDGESAGTAVSKVAFELVGSYNGISSLVLFQTRNYGAGSTTYEFCIEVDGVVYGVESDTYTISDAIDSISGNLGTSW